MIIFTIQALLFFFLAFFSSVIIHEIGHLICGIFSGYKVYQLKFFGFSIVENQKLTLKRTKALPANQCLMVPPEYEKFKFILYNLGGILANFGVVLISFLLLQLTDPGRLTRTMLFLLILFHLYSLITNGLPLVFVGLPNDMKNILLVNSSPSAKKAFHSGFMIDFYLKQGKRMKEIDQQHFELPADFDLSNIYVAYNQMQWAINRMESGEIETGLSILESLAEEIPAYKKYTYYYTIIASTIGYYFYLYDRNVSVADELSKDVKLIRYGTEKKVVEFHLCSLAQNTIEATEWLEAYDNSKELIENCTNQGLKQLYIAQLNAISERIATPQTNLVV